MVTDALRRAPLTPADLAAAAARARGRRGVNRVREVALSCARGPHSLLEWKFYWLTAVLGPGWTHNTPIHNELGLIGYVDAVHPGSRVVVELHSRAHHGDDRFQSDRTRDQRLAALGFVVLRFTWEDIDYRPMDVVETIRRTIAMRTRKAA
jgi:hypothetical protein